MGKPSAVSDRLSVVGKVECLLYSSLITNQDLTPSPPLVGEENVLYFPGGVAPIPPEFIAFWLKACRINKSFAPDEPPAAAGRFFFSTSRARQGAGPSLCL